MKATKFSYVRADSVEQVLELLGRHGDDARILAGGQSLMPTLNMRLSQPRLLIDINRLHALAGISLQGDRVRIGAQARALENQYAVLSSPTAGEAPWSPAVDENRGRAALYVPSDYGMPASGIVAESESDAVTHSTLLIADIDLAAVAKLRTEGQVATRRDWPEQFAI